MPPPEKSQLLYLVCVPPPQEAEHESKPLHPLYETEPVVTFQTEFVLPIEIVAADVVE